MLSSLWNVSLYIKKIAYHLGLRAEDPTTISTLPSNTSSSTPAFLSGVQPGSASIASTSTTPANPIPQSSKVPKPFSVRDGAAKRQQAREKEMDEDDEMEELKRDSGGRLWRAWEWLKSCFEWSSNYATRTTELLDQVRCGWITLKKFMNHYVVPSRYSRESEVLDLESGFKFLEQMNSHKESILKACSDTASGLWHKVRNLLP